MPSAQVGQGDDGPGDGTADHEWTGARHPPRTGFPPRDGYLTELKARLQSAFDGLVTPCT